MYTNILPQTLGSIENPSQRNKKMEKVSSSERPCISWHYIYLRQGDLYNHYHRYKIHIRFDYLLPVPCYISSVTRSYNVSLQCLLQYNRGGR